MNIIEAITENKFVTIPELSESVGKSEPTIHRHLDKLSNIKVLKRVGSRKTGYRELIK